MAEIIVLGGGMVGSAMALDLATNYAVTVADRDALTLDKIRFRNADVSTIQLDVTDWEALEVAIKPFDVVLCAVPGFLGFQTLKTILQCGKDVVDISFFPENALELDALAKEKRVTAIVDCGVAPGMGNVILGRYNEIFEITHFECLVGGLPKEKKWPFAYKAPFSPIDVIEEYTRPARYIENGQIVTREPLTDCEYVDFDKVGTLESFNTDGLRSLLYTMSHIPNMKEKTLRYPGHVEYIKVLKSSGFFSQNPLNIQGISVSPLEFTTRTLLDEWKLREDEEEFTVMRITIKGKNAQGKSKGIVYDLYDAYHKRSGISSMARTTGYTATAAVHLILKGMFGERGVFPPELVGKDKVCFEFILSYLTEREVFYIKTEKENP